VPAERRHGAAAADVRRGAPVDDVAPELPERGAGPDLLEGLRPELPQLALVRRRREAAGEDAAVLVDERDLPGDVALAGQPVVPCAEPVEALPCRLHIVEIGAGPLGQRELELDAVVGTRRFDPAQEGRLIALPQEPLPLGVVVVVDHGLEAVPHHAELGQQRRERRERREVALHRDGGNGDAVGIVDRRHEVGQAPERPPDVPATELPVDVGIGRVDGDVDEREVPQLGEPAGDRRGQRQPVRGHPDLDLIGVQPAQQRETLGVHERFAVAGKDHAPALPCDPEHLVEDDLPHRTRCPAR
jgi:hypothetical protein